MNEEPARNCMKNMFKNKKMLLLCLAAIVLVAVLVVGIIAIVSRSNEGTPAAPNNTVTEPTGTTGGNGNENTDPIVPDVTDPTKPSEGTGEPDFSGDPIVPDDYEEPEVPDVTVPEPTEPDFVPNEGDIVTPDIKDPEDDEDPVINPGDIEIPIDPPTVDFRDVTPLTLTYEVWQSWDDETQDAFDRLYPEYKLTPEEKHNLYKVTLYGNYECTCSPACTTAKQHSLRMDAMAEGCSFCGKHDCAAFNVIHEDTLYWLGRTDFSACPQYDITKDPVYYCQECGQPNSTEGCHKYLVAMNCPYCGEWLEAWECHHCPND